MRGSLGSDFTVISVTNTGIQNWLYKPNFTAFDEANSIVYGGDGNVYAAGYRFITGFPIDDYDIVVISLEPSVEVREEILYPKNYRDFGRFLAAPTIFKDKIHLKFTESSNRNLKITLYNIYGSVVFEKHYPFVTSSLTLKNNRIAKLGSGIYFLSASKDGEWIARVKLIKQ